MTIVDIGLLREAGKICRLLNRYEIGEGLDFIEPDICEKYLPVYKSVGKETDLLVEAVRESEKIGQDYNIQVF
jgi:hypothetical protein